MIIEFVNLEPWWRFAAALLIGALIGLEREFVQQRSGEHEFGGIRTFSLMALLGAVAAYLTSDFGFIVFIAAYLGMILLLWASNLATAVRGIEEGITSEIAALLVPLLGAMVVWDYAAVAGAVGVITALILALKPRLHDLARGMSVADLRATLEFALISAVILPLLPNRGFGPFGVLIPFQIWLLVVFVSGIGFFGYVLMKTLGTTQGVGLTGLLGGVVSSTATTVSFAGRSKINPALSAMLARGIILASMVMFPRVLIEVAVVNSSLLPSVAIPLGAMFVASLLIFFFMFRRKGEAESGEPANIEFSNPLRLQTAVTFGLVFAVVLVIVRAANEYFGSTGVYLASMLTGITDVDSITLTVSELALNRALSPEVASIAIVIASLMNTAAKGVMALVLGSSHLRRVTASAFGLVLLTGLVVGSLTLLI